MTRKCKICGYVFKNKDEVICPECLTARDDDISCDNYSKDLHEHKNFSYNDNFSSSFLDKDDTYEDNNSFIENEKKAERNDQFSNQVQQQATGYNNASKATNATPTFNKNATTFKTYNFSNNFVNNINKPKPKKGSKIFAVIFCIIIISMISQFIGTFVEKKQYNDFKNNILSSSSYDDNNYEFGDDYLLRINSNYKKSEISSTENLNSTMKKTILKNYNNVSEWKTFKSQMIIEPDDDSDESYSITSVECDAIDHDEQIISTTQGIVENRNVTNETNKTRIIYDCSLLYPSDAEKLEFTVTVSHNGEDEENEFTVYL